MYVKFDDEDDDDVDVFDCDGLVNVFCFILFLTSSFLLACKLPFLRLL